MSKDPHGSIEGVITREGTDTPIPGVQVTLHRLSSGFQATTSTDESGRFFVENLIAGRYIIHADCDGYLNMQTANTEVSSGKKVHIPNLHMNRAATIRGRILHSNRHPMAGRFVEFLEPGADADGNEAWQNAGIANTDSEGDYKNSRIAPGEYYIRLMAFPSLENFPNRSDDATIVYFPGTVDKAAALRVKVEAGEEAAADFAVPEIQTYTISGEVTNSLPNGDSLSRLRLALAPKESPGRGRPEPIAILTLPQGSTGDFEFRGIPSGAYDLFATAIAPTSDYLGKVSLLVDDQDLGEVRVVLRPGQDVTGRLIVEDGQNLGLHLVAGPLANLPPTDSDGPGQIIAAVSSRGPKEISLKLERTDGFRGGRYGYGPLVSEDGTSFTFPNVPEGAYRISARGIPLMPWRGDTYLADIRVGGRSVLEDGRMEIGNGPVEPIEVIVGKNGGFVHGTFPDKRNEKAQLLVIPEPRLRNNASLFLLITITEAAHEFNLRGIAPGDYKLLALRTPDRSIPFRSAKFLSRYEPLATAISIQKGVRLSGLELSLATYR